MQSVVADSFDVTTLLGSDIGLSGLLPVEFKKRKEFTLNTHLNIFPAEPFDVRPKLRYFGVGIQGCYNADDGILSSAFNPQRTDMNLYTLIPIRCRPVDEDLSDAERKLYRLRKRQTIKGQEYFLYYLKLIEYNGGIKYKRINPIDGSEEPYELDPSYLSPTPVKPAADKTIISSQAKIVAYCEARVYVEAADVLEWIRVQFDGDTRYAKISEIGFFTGIDKELTGKTGQNVSFNYTEGIYTMLYNHCTWTGTPLTREGMSIDSIYEITSQGGITEK